METLNNTIYLINGILHSMRDGMFIVLAIIVVRNIPRAMHLLRRIANNTSEVSDNLESIEQHMRNATKHLDTLSYPIRAEVEKKKAEAFGAFASQFAKGLSDLFRSKR